MPLTFKELLRFRTVSAEGPSTGAYTRCVDWLDGQCAAGGLETRRVEPVPGKPILWPHSAALNQTSRRSCSTRTTTWCPPWKNIGIPIRGLPLRRRPHLWPRHPDMKCEAQYVLAIGRLRARDPLAVPAERASYVRT